MMKSGNYNSAVRKLNGDFVSEKKNILPERLLFESRTFCKCLNYCTRSVTFYHFKVIDKITIFK